MVRICLALDGLPLAFELVAARVRALSPQQIAARLGDRSGCWPARERVRRLAWLAYFGEVAGMVLVDATHSDLWKRLPPELSKPPDKQPLARFPILAGPPRSGLR